MVLCYFYLHNVLFQLYRPIRKVPAQACMSTVGEWERKMCRLLLI